MGRQMVKEEELRASMLCMSGTEQDKALERQRATWS